MPSETTVPPSIDEGARHRYEVARRQGHPAPLEQFLPDEGDPVFLATLEELVHLELQFAWLQRGSPGADTVPADRPPPVEAYLSRFPRLDQPHIVLRLLRREYLVRRRSGEPAAFDDYRKRFPELVHTSEDLEPAEHQADGDAGAGVFAGARLGRYQVCAEHARGGFGFVWRAIDDHLGREVALKGLKDPWASESSHRQRFLAEARIAARLEHPGVVPVYDLIGREGEPPYYTMKLVRGQTFSAAIRRFHNEPLPEGEQAVEQLRLLNSFLAVARTMAYAHSRRIIHRDLKPANVVLGDYGETIVLDWGLAKDLDRDDASTQPDGSMQPALDPGVTRPGTVMGTPLYMSPEQAAGRTDQVDERSDIYALGAILYQVLTGRRPFEGASSEQVLADVIHTEPPMPRSLKPAIPRALEAICLRAMAKKPEARYAAVTDLTRDLERYLADEPVSAYAEPWHHRAGRWIRRHRSRVAMACGAVLLLGVVAVAWRTVVRVQEQRDEQTAARQREAQQMATSAEELARTRLHGAVSHRDFAEAERILDRACGALTDWPELSDQHARLDDMRGRAYRLSEFYRLADEAWRGNYDELDEESAVACETALGHVGVLENETWWLRLPGDDLLPRQQAQLQHDVHGILLLYAGEVAKEGLSHYQEGSRPDIFTRSLALCRRAQRFQPTHSGSLLEVFCAIGTGELSPAKLLLGMPPLPAAEPTTPVDLHFMGVAHYFLAEAPDIPLSAFLKMLCRVRGSGMDGDTPWETSQRLLVEVTRREPRRFWGYVWLGNSLLSERYGHPRAAEAAFSAAIALRADQPHDDLGLTAGYLGRAVAILRQWRLADEPRTAELLARIEADLDQAKELAPYDGDVRLRRARMYSALARAAKTGEVSAAWAQRTVDEYAVWVEQARPIAGLKDHASLPVVAAIWLQARTDIADMKVRAPSLAYRVDAVTALISLRLGQLDPDVMQKLKLTEPFFEQAVEAAKRVPRNDQDHLRARAAMAGVWLSQAQADPAPGARQAKLAQTLAAFEAVLGKQPENYLAALGRVQSLQLQGQDEPALRRLQAFANRADGQASQSMLAPWQRLEMHLEETRLQHRLGRVDEALRALEPARRLNAVAVHRLEQELWPAK